MNEIWIAIVMDLDDARLMVDGYFDNEAAAIECAQDDSLAARSLVYKIDLGNVKSEYIPFDYDCDI
jgi:hypothetical protein